MKKALIVTNLIGFVSFLWNDIQTLQNLGYEITFAANGDVIKNEDNHEKLAKAGVRFVQLDFASKNPLAGQNIKAYSEIEKLLSEERFDLIHCHTPIAGLITRWAARKCRKKGTRVIYTSHGLAFTKYASKKEWLMYFSAEKIASLFTDTIITINQDDFENAKKLCCKDVRKINGVGVDTAYYHDVNVDVDAYKAKLGLPADKIMVLSVGEISDRKNHQIIIKALGSLQTKADYIYVICGREVDGSGLAERLQRLAQEQGVALYLLGHRSDIPEIMHCSDIGAIPSVREGLGLAGIQSLCAEVPLVGTDVQGIKEYIIDGVSGYLCEPYDETGYAEAILKLSDQEHRNALKRNCFEITRKFDVSVSKRQMEEIYSSIQ